MITLFSISIKFSSQYNEILGYKWKSAWQGDRKVMEIH